VHLPCVLVTLKDFEKESKADLRELDGRPWSVWNEYRWHVLVLVDELDPPDRDLRAIQESYADHR
jgi:hypothetical protein